MDNAIILLQYYG